MFFQGPSSASVILIHSFSHRLVISSFSPSSSFFCLNHAHAYACWLTTRMPMWAILHSHVYAGSLTRIHSSFSCLRGSVHSSSLHDLSFYTYANSVIILLPLQAHSPASIQYFPASVAELIHHPQRLHGLTYHSHASAVSFSSVPSQLNIIPCPPL
ncbi:hypothetical protein ILYODFUR_037189 [Ilyodon furcidens]|uniref:Uncharacterized protein n=1 Tax=Ilyodon furcidens TaxID=33524 RepID=A0ABV0STP7_9TELE